jgi:hypothetical protein
MGFPVDTNQKNPYATGMNMTQMQEQTIQNLAQVWPLLLLFGILALFDLFLKGWAMWRAARMGKRYWFIAILLINSLGILPGIFLLMTSEEYRKYKEKP